MTKKPDSDRARQKRARQLGLVLKLRYGLGEERQRSQVYFSMRQIANYVNLTLNQVQALLRKDRLQAPAKARGHRYCNDSSRKLGRQHIEFLVSEKTLRSWVPYSLNTRAKLFHRKFPDKRISGKTLQKIYRRHEVVYKSIKYR